MRDVKCKTFSLGSAHRYLVMVGERLVNITYVFYIRKSLLAALFNIADVGTVVKQNCIRTVSVTPCLACLLVIRFYIIRHFIMQHGAHIALVNSHSEGIGGDNNSCFSRLPFILPAVSLRAIQPGMIKINTCRIFQLPRKRFGMAAA